MLQPEIYEKHKSFFQSCEKGDTLAVNGYLKDNAGIVLKDGVSYEASRIASTHDHIEIYKQLITFDHPNIYAARSANADSPLGEKNECLKFANIEIKKHDRNRSFQSSFEDFKILGQAALGFVAFASLDAIKTVSTLTENIGRSNFLKELGKLRNSDSPTSENKNKPNW
jgi:hypothetical protein